MELLGHFGHCNTLVVASEFTTSMLHDSEPNYYVYVYIDPRNYEEFYYGKGRGGRKDVHLDASGNSEKAKRIRAIFKED